jgi:acyl carrier protein
VLSSIANVQLVTFLEGEFGVEFEAHEIDPDEMDTLEAIVSLVKAKLE